jgi:predicted NAD/FAD-binding protein
MHVAVIGGGAAGMTSAHYLARAHQVTVLEKRSVPGGNIRTLNRNVASTNLPADLFLDNGVIEFHRNHSPGLHALVEELGLELASTEGGSTGLYLENGLSYHMPGAIRDQQHKGMMKARQYLKLAGILRHMLPVVARMITGSSYPHRSVDTFLGEDAMSRWLKMLLMYGYSIPYAQIDQFPASLAIPSIRNCSIGTRWVRLKGGVYRYIEEIIAQAGQNLSVKTRQDILSVTRNADGVSIECADGLLHADRVVFATPPDQILTLLGDASESEQLLFSNWQANHAETIIHTDHSIYDDWAIHSYSEFDLFEKDGGKDAGYTAYLNRLCDVPVNNGTHFFLSYNLEERIDADKILDRQQHHTPLYTPGAVATVDKIKACNGQNNTFYAGAFLFNGLHEGAVQSGLAIKTLFDL